MLSLPPGIPSGMLKRTLHIAWLLLAAGLFMLAVLLTVARVWAPSLGAYQQDIEVAASAALQHPVSIGRVEATWRGLRPVLRLTNVVIAGLQQARPLGMREIHVSIDTSHFLKTRELRIAGVDIIGTSLTVTRDADGRLMLEELATQDAAEIDFGALAVMSRLSIHDSEVTVRDIPRRAGTQHFYAVSVTVTNEGNDHHVTGHALLPGEPGGRIEFIARLLGDIAKPAAWHGRAYFRGQSLSLSSLLAPLLDETNTVQGVADLRLWAGLASSRITAVSGELEVDELRMKYENAGRQSLFAADNLQTQFGWRQAGQGWQGWQAVLQRLQVTRSGQSWQTGSLSLAGLHKADSVQVRAEAALIDLDEVTALLPVMPRLNSSLRDRLMSAQPTGMIENLLCTFTRTEDAIEVDSFSARFTGLGMLQTGTIPYLSGLDGTINGDAQAGILQLGSDRLVVHDERFFRSALQFDRAGGDVHWRTENGVVQVGSESLVAGNPHLALDARFSLDIPRNGEPVTTDTRIAVREFDIARTRDYLPARIMPGSGVEWLDRSLAGGRVTDGSVIIKGRLDQLPYDHGEGQLEVRLPVSDATLNFNEHWSPLTKLDAQIDITGRQMDIRSHKGFIRNASLDKVHAQIRDLARPELTIRGNVRGELPEMLAELGSSPLGETYGGFVDRVVASGHADLALDIHLPLTRNAGPISVNGNIGLRDNTLRMTDADIELEHIRGQLKFDDSGIRGDGLQVELFGKRASARVWTERDRPVTHVSLDGKLGLIDRMLADSQPLRDVFSGDPDWHVEFTRKGKPVRGKNADVRLSITSSLQGLAIDLPAPFGKKAATARPLSVDIDALYSNERYVHANYGDMLQAVLVLTEGVQGFKLQRGNIALGGETPVPPQIPQLLVSGRLDLFRLEDWMQHLGGGESGLGPPLRVSLKLGKLDAFGYRLHDTGVDIVESGSGWTVKSIGPSAEGELQLTRSAGAIVRIGMDMQRLVLETVTDAARQKKPPPQPAEFPALQVKIRQLLYNNIDFGTLELQTQRQPGGSYRIDTLALSSRMLSLEMNGDWRRLGGEQITHAEFAVTDGNVGMLLDALGYLKLMKGGSPTASLKASWSGVPWDVRTEIVNGRSKIVIKDGQLLEVEPGATGRALGLLSLAKLPRRLTLDFTDLFGAGFSFDLIEGDFVLDSGNAYTEKMVIDGPAAKIEISGRVGLAAQDYDELVTVTPYVNSSLPLAGVLAGGPAVGAAVIVADKLLQGKFGFNELARKQYAVTGPWADPVVTQLNAPEPATARPPDDAMDADGFFQ